MNRNCARNSNLYTSCELVILYSKGLFMIGQTETWLGEWNFGLITFAINSFNWMNHARIIRPGKPKIHDSGIHYF